MMMGSKTFDGWEEGITFTERALLNVSVFVISWFQSHLTDSPILQNSSPKEEIKIESEEQKAQEFEVQKVTIPLDGTLVSKGEEFQESLGDRETHMWKVGVLAKMEEAPPKIS